MSPLQGEVTRKLLFIFVSLSLSHTRVVCKLTHSRDPRAWDGKPLANFPSRPGRGEAGARGREDLGSSLRV